MANIPTLPGGPPTPPMPTSPNGSVLSNVMASEIEDYEKANPEDDPELAYRETARQRYLDAKCPEPELNDILAVKTELEVRWAKKHSMIRAYRRQRYMHEATPEKWKQDLADGRRFYSRLSHNEILRVVAMMGRNPTTFKQPPSGDLEKALKQQRWENEFFPAMERKAGRPIVRMVDDAQAGDGLSAYEIYYDPYDKEYMTKRPSESNKTYVSRTEQYMKNHTCIGIRYIDPLSLMFDEDDNGVYHALIWERKPKRYLVQKYRDKLSPDAVRRMESPRAGQLGTPAQATRGTSANVRPDQWEEDWEESDDYQSTVETIRYYDEKWYAYIVDGELVEGPTEHKMPGVPVIIQEGMVTSSPFLSERYQGITWGMMDMEKALNDLLTRELDNAFVFGRPKVIIETPLQASLMMTTGTDEDKPAVLDLSQPGVIQLNPGQKIADAYAGFKPYPTKEIESTLMMLWQRSGLNPIASGESPGADAAGYTVNTLQGAAQNLYEVLLDNKARTHEKVVNFARYMVRDTIKDKTFLSVPMQDEKQGGTDWLGLGPDDIDETPCKSFIDPLSDANRLAKRQSLEQGNREGFVPRRIVQTEGFGAEDPQDWDDEMIIDAAEKQLAGLALEQAKMIVQMNAQSMMMDQGGGQVNPALAGTAEQATPGGSQVGGGGAPAPLNPPEVGAGQSAASQGPPALSPQTAQAGQDNGYRPISNR